MFQSALLFPLFFALAWGAPMCRDTFNWGYAVGSVIPQGNFVAQCVRTVGDGAKWEFVSCLDARGTSRGAGDEWYDYRYRTWRRCQRMGNGLGLATVACADERGIRRYAGEEWKEMMRYVRCEIRGEEGRVRTVACATDEGKRMENGSQWREADGRIYTCRINPY